MAKALRYYNQESETLPVELSLTHYQDISAGYHEGQAEDEPDEESQGDDIREKFTFCDDPYHILQYLPPDVR